VLITLLDSDAGTFAVPSKTLAYLCAGRAVIIAAPGANKAARVVEEAQAGLIVSPDDPTGIVAAAERFLQDRALLAQCASNGRRYAEQHFSIDAIADRFLEVLRPRPGRRQLDARDSVLANGDDERKPSWQRPA
jgi:glycosyltransferase involved in cell wall biosynthesis